MTNKDLVFAPLGGCNEIGMNMSLYGFGSGMDRRWVMVDLGVSFGDALEGAEAAMADPAFAEEAGDDLLGLIVTHGHEDHIGGIAHVWRRLRVPIYATRFTAALIAGKLAEAGLAQEADLRIVDSDEGVKLGPFEVDFAGVTHSIPEPFAIRIRTPAGAVVHTGDWKLDPAPGVGAIADEAALARWGDEGVATLMCDSTNVFEDGVSGSERDVRAELARVVGEKRGRVALTTFASNVGRLDAAFAAAIETGRDVCLVGRSMKRMVQVARDTGYLKTLPTLLTEDEAAAHRRDRLLILCTGSQGEPRAALRRIAGGQHPRIKLETGDCAIFSSKIIPGNEVEIYGMQNQLAARGVEVVTEKDEPIHVSGHPNRGELKRMYALIKPQGLVPIHGEARHVQEHARFARESGVPASIESYNGAVIRIAGGPLEIVDEVATGRLQIDGGRVIESGDRAFRERRALGAGGLVDVVVVLEADGTLIAGPDVRLKGVPELGGLDRDRLAEKIAVQVEKAIEAMAKAQRGEEDLVEHEAKVAARRALGPLWDKRPLVDARAVVLAD